MAELNLEQLVFPMLFERAAEDRKEKRRQERTTKIAQLLSDVKSNKFTGPHSPEEYQDDKIKAYSELATYGVNLPISDIEPRKNIDEIAKLINAPDALVRGWYNGLYGNDYQLWFRHASMTGDKPSIIDTEEKYNLIKEYLPDEFKDMSFGKYMSMGEVGTLIVEESLKKLFGDQRKPYEFEVRDQVIKDIIHDQEGNLIPFTAINEDPERKMALANAGISQKEIMEAYGYNLEAVTEASKVVNNKMITEMGIGKQFFGEYLDRWKEGNLSEIDSDGKDILEPYRKVFDKYYDKNTGEIKDEEILKQIDRTNNIALRAIGMDEAVAQKIPEAIKPFIVTLTQNSTTKSEAKKLFEDAKNAGLPLLITEKELNQILEYLDD